jgi:WD40 repeat protein
MGSAASASSKTKPITAEEQVQQLQNQLNISNKKNAEICNEKEQLKSKVSELEARLVAALEDAAVRQAQLNQQNAHLLKQLQDMKLHCDTQNVDVCSQNDRLRLKNSELEALLLAAPANPSPSHSTFAKCSAGVVSGKNRRNEQFLRDLFMRHKDTSGGISFQNLGQGMRDADAPIIPSSDQELAGIVKQFDANLNGFLEFGEFQQAVNEPDELQVWFNEKQLPLAADALRPLIGRCSDQLKELSRLSPADIDHAAVAICSIIPGMLKELHQELQSAFAIQSEIEADMKAFPSKFGSVFTMSFGTVSDFHKGLTGRVGMPNIDFKNAMRQEHCEKTGCDVECTSGNYKIIYCPKREWSYVVDRMPCPDMGHNRRLAPISELLRLKLSQDAKLREEEIIAIVLYTGPMFEVYNCILRQYPKERFDMFKDGDNLFSTTIFVLVSAIQKIARFTRIPPGTLLYRGSGGTDLPAIFFDVDNYGCSGYAEWGFLSTTADRNVALGYSGVRAKRAKATLMVIEASSIDRGADIAEFSQYPGEQEFLYLPCSFIQRTRQGNGRVQVVDGGLIKLVSVKVNLNIKTQTVEELQEQKKSLHMVSAKSALTDEKYQLSLWSQSCKQQGCDVSREVAEMLEVFKSLVSKHEQINVEDYSNDEKLRSMMNEIFDTKSHIARAKVWQQTKMKLSKHDFTAAKCVASLLNHRERVRAVAFHPSEPICATGSDDRTVQIWRMNGVGTSATCVATLAGHTGAVFAVAFNNWGSWGHTWGKMLASGGADGAIKLWMINADVSNAVINGTLTGHSAQVNSLAWHPFKYVLASGSRDTTVKLWGDKIVGNRTTFDCIATLQGHTQEVHAVAFHPSGRILASGSGGSDGDHTVRLWKLNGEATSATCIAALVGHSYYVAAVAFHPTLPIMATGSSSSELKLWRINSDETSATCFATAKDHLKLTKEKDMTMYFKIASVSFHPSAPVLATGSWDGMVKIWQMNAGLNAVACIATLTVPKKNNVYGVAFHPSAPVLASANEDGTLNFWQ